MTGNVLISVTQLFKQSERADVNNVSVISVIAKVFETIVYDQSSIFF